MPTTLSDFTRLYRELAPGGQPGRLNADQARLLVTRFGELTPAEQRQVDPAVRQAIDGYKADPGRATRSAMPATQVAFAPTGSPDAVVFDVQLTGTATHQAGANTDDVKAKVNGSIELKRDFVTDLLSKKLVATSPGLKIDNVTWNAAERRYEVSGSAPTTTNLLVTKVNHRAEFKAHVKVDAQRGLVVTFPWGVTNLGNFFNDTAAGALRDGISRGAGDSVTASADGNTVYIRPDLKGLALGSGDASFRIDALKGGITYALGTDGNVSFALRGTDLQGVRLRAPGQKDTVPSYNDEFNLALKTRLHQDGSLDAQQVQGRTTIKVINPNKPSAEHTVELTGGQLHYDVQGGFQMSGDLTDRVAGGQRLTLAGFRGQTIRPGVLEMRAGNLIVEDNGKLRLEVRAPRGELNLTQSQVSGLQGEYSLKLGEGFEGDGRLQDGRLSLDDGGKTTYQIGDLTLNGRKPGDPKLRLRDISGAIGDQITVDKGRYNIDQGESLHGSGQVEDATVTVDGEKRRVEIGHATYADSKHKGRGLDLRGAEAAFPGDGTAPDVKVARFRYSNKPVGLTIQANAFAGKLDLGKGGHIKGTAKSGVVTNPLGRLDVKGASINGSVESQIEVQATAVSGKVKDLEVRADKGATAEIDQRDGLHIRLRSPELGLKPSTETEVTNHDAQVDLHVGTDEKVRYDGTTGRVEVRSGTFQSTAQNFRYQGDKEGITFQADTLRGTNGLPEELQHIDADRLAGEVRSKEGPQQFDVKVTADQARLDEPGRKVTLDKPEIQQDVDLSSIEKVKRFSGKAQKVSTDVGVFQGDLHDVKFTGDPQTTTGTAASLSGKLNLPTGETLREVKVNTDAIRVRMDKLEDQTQVVDVHTDALHATTGDLDAAGKQVHVKVQRNADAQIALQADAESVAGRKGAATFGVQGATAQGDPEKLTIRARQAQGRKGTLDATAEGLELQTAPAQRFAIQGGGADRVAGRADKVAFSAEGVTVAPQGEQLEIRARQGEAKDTDTGPDGRPRFGTAAEDIRLQVALGPELAIKGGSIGQGGVGLSNDFARKLLAARNPTPAQANFLKFLTDRTVAQYTLTAAEFDPATNLPRKAQGQLHGQVDTLFGPVALTTAVSYDGTTTSLSNAQVQIPASDRFAQELADVLIDMARKAGHDLTMEAPPRFEDGKLVLKFDSNDLRIDVSFKGDQIRMDIEKARFLKIISVRGMAADKLADAMRNAKLDPNRPGDTAISLSVNKLLAKAGLPDTDRLVVRNLQLTDGYLSGEFDYSHTRK